jgi:hypothetical protein
VTERSARTDRPDDAALDAGRERVHAGSKDWLLRAIAACSVVAAVVGVLVAPGLHGNATDAIVNWGDRAAAVTAYAMAILVCAGVAMATAELIGSRRAETAVGAVVVAGSSLLVVLLVALIARAHAQPDAPPQARMIVLVAVVASAVASTAGIAAIRRPHTRALALLLLLFALAALSRIGAWELAALGGEGANPSLYALGRVAATVGVMLEAAGQLATAVWIGTRGRAGLVLSSAVAATAFALTLVADLGAHPDASVLSAALHTSLADAAGLPAPYGLGGAVTFLTLSAMLLAAVTVVLGGQPRILIAAFSLALLSRGAFDAPLRAIAIGAAAAWALVAALDDRVLWASLTGRSSRPDRSA